MAAKEAWPVRGTAYVGCSGWHYADWQDTFYPDGLPKSQWLTHYSSVFSTVELNNTFYRLPTPAAVERWTNQVAESFVFAVKGSRYVTHTKRLNNAGNAVATFTDRMRGLGDKLGPVLWQLPPGFQRDECRLSAFLNVLPAATEHVIEFRHQSWWHPDVLDLLRAHATAICLVDMPGFRSPLIATTRFAYIRFHGPEHLYSSCYDSTSLAHWADGLKDLMWQGHDVYVYFNNDTNAYAVKNALTLRQFLASL